MPGWEAGYQPTYEELKHRNSCRNNSGIYGYQPTYEELKRKETDCSSEFPYVTSLPMRN